MPRSTAVAHLAVGADSPRQFSLRSTVPANQPRGIFAVLCRDLVVMPAVLLLLLACLLVVATHFIIGLSLWWLAVAVAAPLLLCAVTVPMARRVNWQLSASLSSLNQKIEGEPSAPSSEMWLREVAMLDKAIDGLQERLEDRDREAIAIKRDLELKTKEVDVSNQQLSAALQQLTAAKNTLVANEKMVSLGELVAGVTHEINTPLGIGVTAVSTLKAATARVLDDYKHESLTHSALENYLDTASQSSEIVFANLNRASELIKSLKQVAVDTNNDELRRFGLRAHIGELLVSLRPQLDKRGIDIQFDCDGSVQAHSKPGALSQILTNLVMNSLDHAYPEGGSGTLRLQVSGDSSDITLTYSDDGCGITPLHLERMFEPFFTTRRDSGGSGLGMHIVMNLLSHQLYGSLDVESEVGVGTTFRIRFPADISKISRYGEQDAL
ncbi:HAMP domain-containing histidine kinase [Spongiibacter nanhainus]|uniref:histidine kinase n=1 Tax=Spongiibacter nanhainus TaxID=2794344 RepID=A0A7T4URB3_9GAMM|nr:HAMP domain-containing sensor histidine kinase [Spongiibacter nanhainus]QQD19638.1 HAMP domain-containing histidine kinase [Spongiibacter nanhainus]